MTEDEKRAQEAEIARDLKALYPTDEAWHQRHSGLPPPKDEEGRRIYDFYNELYPHKEADKVADDKVPPEIKKLSAEQLAEAQAAAARITSEIQALKINPAFDATQLDKAAKDLKQATPEQEGFDYKNLSSDMEKKQDHNRQEANERFEENKEKKSADKVFAHSDTSDVKQDTPAEVKPPSSLDATQMGKVKQLGADLNKQQVTVEQDK